MIAVEFDDRCADPLVAAEEWSTLVAGALERLGVVVDARVGVMWVSAAEIGELARTHLGGQGGDTDVLSFPLDGADGADALVAAGREGSRRRTRRSTGSVERRLLLDLGDIVVCPEVARRQAPSHSGDEVDEVAVLLVHSCCHLLGYDHDEPVARERMWAAERDVLGHLWRPLGHDPWNRR